VDIFCYQARKWIGALAAGLGGLDTLVFSGGIGENAAEVRCEICSGLEHLGVRLDPARNAAKEAVISTAGSQVAVRVIPTDEEIMIARATSQIANLKS
jgi:acetate kinase